MSEASLKAEPPNRLFPIWGPADFKRLKAHARKFRSLAILQCPPVLPAHDGDIAMLEELRDKIFELCDTTGAAPFNLPFGTPQHAAAMAVAERFNLTPGELFRLERQPWTEPLEDLMADWPERVIAPVVIP
jgi:hypothetical protein